MVAELDQGALGRGAGEGAGRGAVPWAAAEPERAATGVHPGRAVEGSEPAGPSQAPGGQPLDHPAGGQVAVGGAGCVNAVSDARAAGDGSLTHPLRKVAEGTVAMVTGLQEER